MVFLNETINIKSHVKKLDKVIVSIITALIVIAVLDPNQLTESIMFIGEALKGIFIFLLASVLLASFAKATGLDQQHGILWSPFQSDYCGILFWRPISLLFLWCSSNHSGTANGWCATRAGNGILFCVTTHGPFHVPAYGTCLRVRIHASQANLCNNYRHYCRLGSPSFQGSSFAVITLTRPQS